MVLRNVVDELHDDDGFADSGAAEQADLAALQEGLDEIDDLDARLEHLFARRLLVEERRGAMDWLALVLADGAEFIDRLADNVDDAAEGFAAHGDADGAAEVDGLHAADHAVSGFHGDCAYTALAQVLLHLENDADGRGHGETFAGDAQRLVDGRHRRFFKLHVHRGTGDLDYLADVLCHFFPRGPEPPNRFLPKVLR